MAELETTIQGLADVAESGDGATSAVRSADTAAGGVATPNLVDDAGELYQNYFQTSALGEDQQKSLDEMLNQRQVVKDGQIVFGAKPKPIKLYDPYTTTTLSGTAAGQWETIYKALRSALGTPYVWGGESPGGFDCSGLVQWAFRKAGIKMPRLSYDQMKKGRRIKWKDLRPGDLIGWDNTRRYPGADHIAVYIGNGKIIEAPRPGRSVQISGIYDRGRAWAVRVL